MQAHEVETTAEIVTATADATETAPLLETAVGKERPVVTVPYSSLHPSPFNARTKPLTGIPALAVSIHAKGLLQNLVVHETKGSRGRQRKYGVCAGQRREAALDLLFEQKDITADYPVPVRIVSEGEALAISLIENSEREGLGLFDVLRAYRMLAEEGRSIDYIAALSGLYVLSHQTNINAALSTASIAVNRRCPSVARTAPVHRRHISVTCRDKHMCNGYAVAR